MVKTPTGQAKKRRLAIAGIFALSVAMTAPLFAPNAGAVVANPGVLDVAMNLTVSTPTFTLAGMRTNALGAATLGKNGVITIPQSNLNFDPVVVKVDLPNPAPADPTAPAPDTATVQAIATSDFSGGLDPGSGAAFIVGDIQEVWTQTDTMTSCVVGPFHIAARTNAQGAHAYQAKTGTVSMVDPGFTVDAVPVSAAGCGGLEGSVNSALGLPVTTTTTTTNPLASTTTTTFPANAKPPIPSVVVSLTFSPAPQAAPVTPVTRPHQPQTTTTKGSSKHPTATTQPQIIRLPLPGQSSGSGSSHHQAHRSSGSHRSSSPSRDSSSSYRTKRKIGSGWTTRPSSHPAVRPSTHPRVHHSASKPATKPAAKPQQSVAVAGQSLNFKNAAFIKRPQSALATTLDLIGLLGLLGFSTLALWLVTSELSEFSAVSRRLRTHRIAGINK